MSKLPPPLPPTDLRDRPPPPRPGLLPLFFLANLLAVYIPGMLLAAVHWKLSEKELGAHGVLRTFVMDVLESPYALASRLFGDVMFQFRGLLGEIGSFYVFVIAIWVVLLGLSLVFSPFSRRYLLTLALAMLSAGQAVLVSMQMVNDQQQEERQQQAEPKVPGGMQPVDPQGGRRNFDDE